MATPMVAERPVAPFIVSLFAGLLILVGGGMMISFANRSYYGYAWMMNGYYGMMGGYGGPWFYAFSLIGIVSGILVLVGAIMLYNHTS